MNSSLLKIVGLFLGLLVVIGLTSFSVFKDFGSDNGSIDKNEVEKIIAQYIQNNPQAILDSVTKYQQRSVEEAEQKAQSNVLEKREDLENDPASPVAGNPKGDVVIVEFFDYSCGYCKKVMPTFVKLLEEDKNIKAVFKELPILGPNSELSARAAISVYMIAPDKYFEFHKKLMGSGRISGQGSINVLAKALGIDTKTLEEKMKSKEVESAIAKDKALASEIGIHGTPAFIIDGNLVPGAIDLDTFKTMVANARAKKSGSN